MSVGFAVRKDSLGYRGVNSPDEVEEHEFFSEQEPDTSHQKITNYEVEVLRLTAYAHPVTGSDRFFAELASLRAEGFSETSSEVKALKSAGLSRKEEIKAIYPYPEQVN